MLLAKLGMIGENSDDFEDLSEEKKLNLSIKSLKL